MKNLSIIIVIFVALSIVSCKKEKQSVIPPIPNEPVDPVIAILSAYTQKLNNTWICDGYWIYSSHPSNQDPDHTYVDTTIYKDYPVKIDVIDDTTIMRNNITYHYWSIDTAKGTILYSEYKIREAQPNWITYYYMADSIVVYKHSFGVSFSSESKLYSK